MMQTWSWKNNNSNIATRNWVLILQLLFYYKYFMKSYGKILHNFWNHTAKTKYIIDSAKYQY